MPRRTNEEIANSIAGLQKTVGKISSAVKQIKSSGINPDALYVLIQRAAGPRPEYRKQGPIPLAIIKAVCDGLEDIEEYVFPKED